MESCDERVHLAISWKVVEAPIQPDEGQWLACAKILRFMDRIHADLGALVQSAAYLVHRFEETGDHSKFEEAEAVLERADRVAQFRAQTHSNPGTSRFRRLKDDDDFLNLKRARSAMNRAVGGALGE